MVLEHKGGIATWCRLFGAYIGCVFAAGPVVGWQIWQPLLIDAGYCETACSSQNGTIVLHSIQDVAKMHHALDEEKSLGEGKGMQFRNLTTDDPDVQLKRILAIGDKLVASSGALESELVKAEVRTNERSKELQRPVQVTFQLESGCDRQYEILANMYSLASALSQMFVLPLGIAFDRHGPQWSAVDGAVTCATGLSLLIAAIMIDQTNLTLVAAMGYVGLFVADVGSMLNSLSLSGFLFLLPNHKSFVVSLSGSSYAGAALLAFLPNILVGQQGWSVHLALLVMSALSVSAAGLGLLCPDRAEYSTEAESVIGVCITESRSAKENIKDTIDMVRQHAANHTAFTLYYVSMTVFWMYYGSVLLALVTHYLSSEGRAMELMYWYNLFYAITGIIAGPFAGRVADILGFPRYLILAMLLQGSFSVLAFVPTYEAQMAAAFLCCCWSPLIGFIVYRWAAYYSFPDLLGTFIGLMSLVAGGVGAIANSAITYAASSNLRGTDIYEVPSELLAMASLIAAIIFACIVRYTPPPAEPPIPSRLQSDGGVHSKVPQSEEEFLALE